MIDIKECPICGETDDICYSETKISGVTFYRIFCDVCGCSTKGFLSIEGAEKAWDFLHIKKDNNK